MNVGAVPIRSKTTGVQVTYETDRAKPRVYTRDRVAYLVRLGTLAYWVPAIGINLITLTRSRFSPEALNFVFWLMFRESVVFLTLWFGFGAVQAMLFGRRRREPRPPRHLYEPSQQTQAVPSRDRRAH